MQHPVPTCCPAGSRADTEEGEGTNPEATPEDALGCLCPRSSGPSPLHAVCGVLTQVCREMCHPSSDVSTQLRCGRSRRTPEIFAQLSQNVNRTSSKASEPQLPSTTWDWSIPQPQWGGAGSERVCIPLTLSSLLSRCSAQMIVFFCETEIWQSTTCSWARKSYRNPLPKEAIKCHCMPTGSDETPEEMIPSEGLCHFSHLWLSDPPSLCLWVGYKWGGNSPGKPVLPRTTGDVQICTLSSLHRQHHQRKTRVNSTTQPHLAGTPGSEVFSFITKGMSRNISSHPGSSAVPAAVHSCHLHLHWKQEAGFQGEMSPRNLPPCPATVGTDLTVSVEKPRIKCSMAPDCFLLQPAGHQDT
ncbi:uncharacterized protein ACIB01_012878 [Guaruba guarouba]